VEGLTNNIEELTRQSQAFNWGAVDRIRAIENHRSRQVEIQRGCFGLLMRREPLGVTASAVNTYTGS
jgi:hypothetical protein